MGRRGRRRARGTAGEMALDRRGAAAARPHTIRTVAPMTKRTRPCAPSGCSDPVASLLVTWWMAGNGITTKKSIAKHWKELGREGQSQVVAKYEHELPLNFKLAPRWWVDAHCVEGSVGRQRKKEAKAQWKKMSREEQDATRADARSSQANGARGQKKATQGRAVNGGPSAPPAAFCAEQRAAACPSVSAGPPVGCVFFFTRQFSNPARRATGLAACARSRCRITI